MLNALTLSHTKFLGELVFLNKSKVLQSAPMKKIFFFLLTLSTVASAKTLDDYLRQRLMFFQVDPLELIAKESNTAKLELGKKLFIETNLSGNRNVSCKTCHNPMKGTSDALPLSQTEDGKGVLRRNSQALFNLGQPGHLFMFWDGRVHYNPVDHIFTTPEPALNGKNPLASHITNVMTSSPSAQAIFPLLSHEEMRGKKGDNEIADAKTNLEAWDLLVKRLTTEEASDKDRYIRLFNQAYPEISNNAKNVNIGHVGEALGTFMKQQFQSNTSPFHRYVAGDDTALSEKEKKGLAVFIDRGRCITCHQGNMLGLNIFFTSVGVPHLGARPTAHDRGRGEINNETFRNHFFKTPSLINVGLTAPYMHNGAFKTIKEVITHYNNIRHSLHHFELSPEGRKEFPVEVEILNDSQTMKEIFGAIQAPFLRQGLGLTDEEMSDLEAFLTNGLTDPKWVH